ncbi:LLM class F420-dependent oxidoreductase [Rhodococcus sp. HNM0569]|uniref:LLM class F420-dependent oxidoreductase n=1 Tax=Rhodococcus sp. HNM0569 TaxID=2716340 RepID=UPI00146D0939|nr:LLM class F420-dependent oxidoreductase [Rhodococcus sp. HNM0569]NLU84643.1 LLM class F420-dependent oxidoreductase [Rhodococcus sp. HNM0569]
MAEDARLDFGTYGVWRPLPVFEPELANAIETLGYGTIWAGGSPPADLDGVERLIAGTNRIVVATGIVNIWTADAHELAQSYHRIEAAHPGRLVLGIGVGHPEQGVGYTKPYRALVDYLDVLDAEGVPVQRRVLAALGPKVLELAANRSAGAHPYLTTPPHTAQARQILGDGVLLAPEQKVVVGTDVEQARAVGRDAADMYLKLQNYVNNLKRLGYTDDDIAQGGSDALIDALVAHGTPEYVAGRVREHLDAGADHVAIQVLPMRDDPAPALAQLADRLGLGLP